MILGESVTKFAKSPKIWNFLYDHFEIKSKMIPIDTTSENLSQTIDRIRNDVEFGLISSPLKADPYWKTFQCSKNVELSESANFFQIQPDGDLFLENFDGQAAIESLCEISENPWEKKIAIMGTGPLGRTVASALMLKSPNLMPDITFVTQTSRDDLDRFKLFKNNQFSFLERSMISELDFGIVINCTPVGSPRNPGSLLEDQDFASFHQDTVYFDVNYGSPSPTAVKLARKNGLDSLDGSRMNLIQATDAFCFANKLDMPREEMITLIQGSRVLH